MTTPGTQSSGLSTSFIRTLVPIVIGPIIARFTPGLDPHDPNVLLVVSAIASYVYYVVVRLLELKAPQVGYLLGIAKAPAYSSAPSPSPEAGEHIEAVVVPDAAPDEPVAGFETPMPPPADMGEVPPQPVDEVVDDTPPLDDPVEPADVQDVDPAPMPLVAKTQPKKRAPRKKA